LIERPKQWLFWARGRPRRGNASHRPQHAATRLPPAGPPEAQAEILCRRRRRRNYGSACVGAGQVYEARHSTPNKGSTKRGNSARARTASLNNSGPGFLAPLTHEPRDAPRSGALSLLQKPLHCRGGSAEVVLWANLKVYASDCVNGGGDASRPPIRKYKKNIHIEAKPWSLNAAWWTALGQSAPSTQASRHTPAPGKVAGGRRRGFMPQSPCLV
jgi:hypothetical protein